MSVCLTRCGLIVIFFFVNNEQARLSNKLSDLYIFDVIKEILKIDTKHECSDRAQLSGSCAGGNICTHCMACRYACNDVYRHHIHHNLSKLQETVQHIDAEM